MKRKEEVARQTDGHTDRHREEETRKEKEITHTHTNTKLIFRYTTE